MMLPLVSFLLYLNSLLTATAFAANFVALCLHLWAWDGTHKGKNSEKLGYSVFASVLFSDLAYLFLCKIPLLHRDWLNRFTFGPDICHAVLVLHATLSAFPFIVVSVYLSSLWIRLRRRRSTYETQLAQCSPKTVSVVVLGAMAVSATMGLVISFRFEDDTFVSEEEENEEGWCRSTWRLSLYLSSFRWLAGFAAPLGLLALPSLTKLFLMRRELDERLRPYVSLCTMLVFTTFLLNLPSLVLEVVDKLASPTQSTTVSYGEDVRQYSPAAAAVASSASESFVTYVLGGLLPELQLLYIPLGVLIVLPRNKKCLCHCCCCCCSSPSRNIRESTTDGDRRRFPNGEVAEAKKRRSRRRHQGEEDEEGEAEVLMEETTSEILNQRLSRSQTTVV